MAYNPDPDLTQIFADGFGTVPVVKGGTTVQGFFNTGPLTPSDGFGLEVNEQRKAVVVQASAITLLENDAVTVDGVAGRVRDPNPIEDGKLLAFFFVPN